MICKASFFYLFLTFIVMSNILMAVAFATTKNDLKKIVGVMLTFQLVFFACINLVLKMFGVFC